MGALLSFDALLGLSTLTLMEIVLGIDNVVFIAILVAKLPAAQQNARAPAGPHPGARHPHRPAPHDLLDHGAHAAARDLRGERDVGAQPHPAGRRALPHGQGDAGDATRRSRGTPTKRRAASRARCSAGAVPDPPARHRVLARFRDHRGGHGEPGLGHDRGDGPRHARDARVGGSRERLRRAAPERQDPGAVVPPPHRRDAGGRGDGHPHGEGLRLLRDGVLPLRRDAEPALPAA